jgi:hypothetical protein
MRYPEADETHAFTKEASLPIQEGDVIIADSEGNEFPIGESLYESLVAQVHKEEDGTKL